MRRRLVGGASPLRPAVSRRAIAQAQRTHGRRRGYGLTRMSCAASSAAPGTRLGAVRCDPSSTCPACPRWWRSACTTPPLRWSGSPPTASSPTSPAAPGPWSASNETRRCSSRQPARPASPTRPTSTAQSATCATSWACGRGRSPCVPGTGRTSRRCAPRPLPSPRWPRSSTSTTRCSLRPGTCPRIVEACRRTGQQAGGHRPPSSDASSTASPWHTAARCTRCSTFPDGTSTPCTSSAGCARNALICQLTAEACGLPVPADPGRGRRAGKHPWFRRVGCAPGQPRTLSVVARSGRTAGLVGSRVL